MTRTKRPNKCGECECYLTVPKATMLRGTLYSCKGLLTMTTADHAACGRPEARRKKQAPEPDALF